METELVEEILVIEKKLTNHCDPSELKREPLFFFFLCKDKTKTIRLIFILIFRL